MDSEVWQARGGLRVSSRSGLRPTSGEGKGSWVGPSGPGSVGPVVGPVGPQGDLVSPQQVGICPPPK